MIREDKEIIEMYWKREEAAIQETDLKYGKLCHHVAGNILSSPLDCEECVNDTYLAAWNTMPPKRPIKLSAYISRITRNLALNRYDYLSAAKRNAQAVCSMEELGECVSGRESVESELAERYIETAITDFLWQQSEEKRCIFIRRYWYFDSIAEIAQKTGLEESKVRSILFRLRGRLRAHLEKEGIEI